MSLSRAHTWGVWLTTLFGSLAILSCTGWSVADGLLTGLALLGAWLGKRARRLVLLDAPATPVVLTFGIAAVALTLGASTHSLPLQGVRLVWSLWCARLATARFASHDGQALLLSIMLVCAATVLSPSPWLAPALLLFVTSLTSTLVTRQLLFDVTMRGFVHDGEASMRQSLARRDVLTLPYFASIAVLASWLLVAGAIVFACFPRSQAPSASGAHQGTGAFPDSVSLTAAPRARSAGFVLVRAHGLSQVQFDHGLYLKAESYDAWRDGAFHMGGERETRKTQERGRRAPSSPPLRYELRFLSDVFVNIPSLGPMGQASVQWTGLYSPLLVREPVRLDSLTAGGPPRSVSVTIDGPMWPDVTTTPSAASCDTPFEDERALERFREWPKDMDARIAPLAHRIAQPAANAPARARLLRQYLATHQTYSLTPSGAGSADPLADFFFGGKSGHCEYFATAYALLLRAVGVPARVVGGLAFGAWDAETQTVLFRASHAHAWVEWWDPCRGWLLDDATPPVAGEWLGPFETLAERWRRAWDEHVLSYGAEEQWALLVAAGRVWSRVMAPLRLLQDSWMWPAASAGAGVLAALVTLAVGVLWLRVPRGLRFEQRLARLLEERLVSALGRPLRKGETFAQAAHALGVGGREASVVIALYERQRFGRVATPLPAAERRSLLARATQLFAPSEHLRN